MTRRWLPFALLLLLVVAIPSTFAAYPCAVYKTWTTNETLSAADLNSSFVTVGQTNAIASCLQGLSANTSAMQATVDPYPSSVESLPSTLEGEIHRLRHVIKQMTGWTQWYTHTEGGIGTPRGYISGFTMNRNSGDVDAIDIAIGTARDVDDTVTIKMAAALTAKRVDEAWVAGSSAGCLDTGAYAGSTTYHIFSIRNPTSGVNDALCSLQATSPTMPSGFTKKRRIGAVMTDATPDIRLFSQRGDEFLWDAVPTIYSSGTNPGTSAILATLTVPVGIKVIALFGFQFDNVTSTSVLSFISSPDVSDQAPSATAAPLTTHPYAGVAATNTGASVHRVRTNTASQIRYRLAVSAGSDIARIATHGWIDARGKDD